MLDWLRQNKEWVFSGAGVSAIVLVGTLVKSRWNRRTRRLRVNLAFGFLTFGPRLSEQMLLFRVGNPLERAVQLTGIRIPVAKGSIFFPHLDGERHFPCVLEPGTSLRFWVGQKEVEDALRQQGHKGRTRIRAVLSDALGNEYRSNAVRLEI
jgi:hypothetical protein